jgi:branched-chain amino acid transport system permease protein
MGTRVAAGIVAASLLLAAPFLLDPYYRFLATMMIVYSIVAIGLNLLTGYSGQISLGHGGFLAIGAYTTAIAVTRFDLLPYAPAILLGAVVTALAGLGLGFPALRLSGPYLAIVTVGFSIAVPQALLRFEWLTGGVQGILVPKPGAPGPLGRWIDPEQWVYLLALLPAAALAAVAANLFRTGAGRALVALRDSEVAAQSVGISLRRYKLLAFTLSAFYTGLAGGLYTLAVGFVSPDSFTLLTSIQFLTMIVVGGLGSVFGSILGAVVITLLPNYASEISKAAPWAIYGAVLIAFMIFLPTGLAGLGRRLRARRPSAPRPAAVAAPASIHTGGHHDSGRTRTIPRAAPERD